MKGAGITLICAITLVCGNVLIINKNGCPLDQTQEKLLEHNNCNKFYQCVRGELVERICPNDLLFNINTDQCDWPQNVVCGHRVIPDDEDKSNGENGGDDENNNSNCKCNPSEAPNVCAAKDSNGLLIAHENCNQFYKCFNGVPVAQNCPSGLLYNPYREQCDWPKNVNCGDRAIPQSDNKDEGDDKNEGGCVEDGSGDSAGGGGGGNGNCNCSPGDAPSICGRPGSNGVLIAHENCNQFYKCFNGEPVAMSCPGTLLYNPYLERCEWPETVTCGDRVIPEDCETEGGGSGNDNGNGNGDGGAGGGGNGNNNGNCNCNPGEAPSICGRPGSNGVLVAHENCNQFYKCYNGAPVAKSCPGTLLYDPHLERCEWPETVKCGDRVIPEDGETDGGGSGNDNGNGNGDGGAGGGGAGGGGNGDNNGSCNCNPGEAPSICGRPGSNGVLVAHENCNQFYKCYNGAPVAKSCPGTLLYDPYLERCEWPETVTCGDRVIPEDCETGGGGSGNDNGNGNGDGGAGGGGAGGGGAGGGGNGDNNGTCNCNPGEAPSICGRPGSNGVLVAHENCNQFYKCYNGEPVAMSCPGTLLYDPYLERCEWPETVKCGDRVIPEDYDTEGGGSGNDNGNGNGDGGAGDGGAGGGGNGDNNGTCNCNPGEAPSICGRPGSNGVLVAHENCNQFYKCYNGEPVAMSCPGTLLYDPHLERCEWPETVTCGDRVIPEDCETDGGGSGNDNGNGNGDGGAGGGGAGGGGNGDNNGTCNCNPGEAPSICGRPGSNGVLVAHENCNQFYKCYNGAPVAKSCPGTLLYDPYLERCEWPETVKCGDRVIPEDGETDGGGSGNDNGNGNGDGGAGGGGAGGGGNGDNNGTCNCNPGEAPSICGRPGSNGVLVAHENCNQFYKCYNGEPVAMSCPGTLLYDPYLERCEWPETVKCGDRVIPEDCETGGGGSGNDNGNGNGDGGAGGGGAGGGGNGDNNGTCNCNPGEAPSICGRPGSNGVLVAHENCNQFYKCYNGEPVAMSCPGTLLYDPHLERCEWPETVKCGDRVIPEDGETDGGGSGNDNGNGNGDGGAGGGGAGGGGNGDNNGTCNCNPGEAPSICGRPGSNGVLVAHENCNQFYKCYNGEPVAMSCPGTLLYDPYLERCEWPETVKCGDRVIPEDCETGGGGSGNDNGNGNGDGGAGGGGAGGGGNGDNNGTCNCNPGEAPSICGRPGSNGVLVAHENCNQFYKCYNGEPVAMSCPGTLLYDPYLERCEWPETVKCGDRVIPEDCETGGGGSGNDNGNGNGDGGAGGGGAGGGGNGDNNGTCNCNPGEAPSICGRPGSNGVLVAHENCNQFYKCYNGEPVAMSCPGTLLYDPYLERCEWPETVKCGDRVIPEDGETDGGGSGNDNGNGNGDGGAGGGGAGGGGNGDNNGTCNCNPGEAPSICGRPGSNGVLVAHENCNQFYKCYNGEPVAMNCPGTLLYDPYLERCEWPETVTCGDRVIPEDCETDGGGSGNDNGNGNGDGGAGGGGAGGGGAGGGGAGGGGNGDNNGTCNCNPGEAPSICGRPGSNGVLVAHENCNQFYKCYNGEPVAMSCPGTLLYDPHLERCEWPETVKCGDRVIPEDGETDGGGSGNDNGNGNGDGGAGGGGAGGGGNGDNNGTCNCNPGEAPSICGRPGSNGVLVAHENCNQFYKCYNGEPVAMSCPGTLLYDPYLERCEWPETVKCGDRVIPEDCETGGGGSGNDNGNGNGDGGAGGGGAGGGGNGDNNGTCNCNPGEAPSICGRPGSNGVLVAHENCNQFYKCYNGEPVAMSCPGTLLYDPYLERCEWPETVKCGDRVIPEDCETGGGGSGNDNGNGNGDGGAGGGGAGGGGNGDNNGTCNCNPGEAPSICGRPGSNGVLVAHENCNQFYKCYNGEPVAMSCPGTLLYDPYLERCEWPETVTCGDRVIPEDCETDGGGSGNDNGNGNGDGGAGGGGAGGGGNGDNNGTCNCNPGEAPSICSRPGSNGVLVAHENCNQFYKCYNGAPVAKSCPGTLLYDPYLERCEWPETVKCGDRVIPEDGETDGGGSGNDNGNGNGDGGAGGGGAGGGGNGDNNGTCNCNPGEAPSICGRPGSNGVLVAHENCNQFYKCYNGEPVAMSCPGTLLYDPYLERCEWPETVTCGDRVIPEDCETDGGGSGNDNGNGNGDGGAGGGGNGDNNGTCNCNPEEAPSICSGLGSNGVLVAHGNCNQFYKCFNGEPVAMNCPGTLLYNPYVERCDWPETVKCGDRVIPEDCESEGGGNGDVAPEGGGGGSNSTCNCNPGEAPSICAQDNSNGVLIAHEICNQFYKCFNGIPTIQSCPSNLMYNPQSEECDWPNNVVCGDRLKEIEDNNNNDSNDSDNIPIEVIEICASDSSDSVYIAHQNCNQFYVCIQKKPVVLTCPANLFYDPVANQCDWSQNVDCGNRVR